MRAFLLVAFAIISGLGSVFGDEAVDKIVRAVTASPRYDLSLIPAHQKADVIGRLRKIAEHKGSYVLIGTAMISPMSADLQLVRLGDTVTIERLMRDYRAYDSMTSWDYVTSRFRYSRQPRLIPYLAEDFNLAEDAVDGIVVEPPPNSGEFVIGVPPRSIFSAVIVIEIIQKAPDFSVEMKAWAVQQINLRHKEPRRFRDEMRAWWEANKVALTQENYKAVVPGPDVR